MKWFVALVGVALVAASFVLAGYGPTVTDSSHTIQCGSKRQGQAEARQQDLINSAQGERTNLYGACVERAEFDLVRWGLLGAGGLVILGALIYRGKNA